MLELVIPGRGDYRLVHLVLDMNGTIAVDGRLLAGVAERLRRLAEVLAITVITADTHGGAAALAEEHGLDVRRLEPGAEAEQKAMFVNELGPVGVVAVGNGANDVGMLRAAAVGIAVLEGEGAAADALAAADVVAPSIEVALDLLLRPERLAATLRR